MQMGLFDFLFGKKKPKADMKPIFFPLSGYSPVYTSTDGAIYELALCKAVIHRIASESSKGKPALTKQNKKIEFIVANIVDKIGIGHIIRIDITRINKY